MAMTFMMIIAMVGAQCAFCQSNVQLTGDDGEQKSDTTAQISTKMKHLIPQSYEELLENESIYDMSAPSNIETECTYDAASDSYVIRHRIGGEEIGVPFRLTAKQYNAWMMRKLRKRYFRMKDAETAKGVDKKPFNVLDMNFSLGPLEKIFGPGGVQLRTQGSVQISTGIKSTKTDNPALSMTSRRKTFFDFDQKIQASVAASVGDRLKFDMTYNTDATFNFDSKNLKLKYEGTDDDIVKSIEAGNVSMTTGSSLIRGTTALFGVKSKLQFGRLTATALVSQQNSESRSISTKGGVQTTPFNVTADNYDQNRHYFLGHFFRDNYDDFASHLPYVNSGVQITRIEVWVTNKSGNFNQSRNIVAFMDLGENSVLANDYWKKSGGTENTSNESNNLLTIIKNDYPGARNINTVTQDLEPLREFGIEGGLDFEKVESARLLSESDYTLNPTLGYISLKSQLSTDEVLGVAFEYTYRGQVYKVGEFSSDITSTDQSLYVKMLKNTVTSTSVPMWHLMMKNVYSLGGAYSIQKSNFKLQIKYLSDTTGTEINYLPVPGINNMPLLQVMNLDRLDSNQDSNPDGFFDFIEGYTIISSSGKIIFPVVEPFGKHLAKKIGNKTLAEKYVYQQLYDSTLVVARQFADKNKFTIMGEYQASSGAQIRLGAMNVPRGSVVVTAGGMRLTENTDYTVDYAMGIVTITNTSILESGQSINVTLENQSLFSTQRKTLTGLDLNYRISRDFNIGATIMNYSEKALTEKVGIGDELVNNTMLGLNFSYNTEFMWLTDLIGLIPTVNATQASRLNLSGEIARLIPHSQKSSSNSGSSYIDDFESAQTGIDLRSPYAWFLSSTPYDSGSGALFPEAALSNNPEYGKNRALINWYYIDRLFTQRNSSLAPGYIRSDLKQLSNPYVREITSHEIFPYRQLSYGESSTIQTLNISYYPTERGPYNVDATNINDEGELLYPEKRWGGIMRRLDNTNFEQSNIEYVQFWLLNPFLDPENPNYEGGDLYLNFGDISEDILKDGLKSYENGITLDGNDQYMRSTTWGRVSTQNSLTYAFDNNNTARPIQDVGLDGLKNESEFTFDTYANYLNELRQRLPVSTIERMQNNRFSPFNDPAGDNYHFYRGHDYDEERLSILERYKRYNGVEGNSLSPEDAGDPLYQSSRSLPDVEDINQDNTLNEYERYFQYRISIRPEDLVVGKNYITDKQVSLVPTRDGNDQEVEWYQFKVPLSDYEKIVGNISDFSAIRFVRLFLTGFKRTTHLRFATFELVKGEWRPYAFNLNSRGDAPADGELDISVVNIEENSGRTPVNYVLPPGVSRISDPSQSQIIQLNEQSMSLKVSNLQAGDARAVYKNTSHDLRNYKRLQMWVHAESFIDDHTDLRNGEMSIFIRLGSDVKNNYYEYEIPLNLTPHGHYNDTWTDRQEVWPESNYLNLELKNLVNLKKERNRAKRNEESGVGFGTLYTGRDPDNERNRIAVIGNPSLSDVRVMLIGIRNNSATMKDGIVWVNELKVTDFENDGGWAAKANANLSISDIANLNIGTHIETDGFGGVDQTLNTRRMDTYNRYDFSVQADLGRFMPAKAQLRAPIYYSVSREKTSPKYNPLDKDVLLKDALNDAATHQEKDSINAFAIQHSTIQSFSLSGLNFGIRGMNPKPWDPANFTGGFSFNKQTNSDPTTEYEYINDYRGSFQYSYTPMITGLKPFGKLKGKSQHLKFFKEWEFNWLPNNISFLTTMSRYYYEQQTRSEIDVNFQLPVSVSKNFLWDRQLSLTWNMTKSLNLSFTSNTAARIDETVGAVNRKLFPDKYRDWKDTVMQSIMHLGTPWAYNQTFVASYKAPFNSIKGLDFLSGDVNYNSHYRWDRGATVDNISYGNSINNQGSWTANGRLNFESIYSKVAYLKQINTRFGNNRRNSTQTQRNKPRRFERTYALKPDTSIVIRHNLHTRKVRVSGISTGSNRAMALKTKIIDENNVEILNRGDDNIKFVVSEVINEHRNIWSEIGAYATRFAISPRSATLRWRKSNALSLPLFKPEIGDVFGQSRKYGPMSPGMDFAFGLTDESYIDRAKERDWLLCDPNQISPAIFSRTHELHMELNLEPLPGLKIQLTSNRTDNRSKQIQFMYDNMPTSLGGSYTKTHCAIATALRGSSAKDGYNSAAFNKFIENIDIISNRIQQQYVGKEYPKTGFMANNIHGGRPFDPKVGDVSRTGSDVLIPAFLAAYSGTDAHKQYLNPFPTFAHAVPNWRMTYDGFINLWGLRKAFKSFTLTHAYQCTYTVGSYSSFLNWAPITGESGLGFTLDELSGNPIPSSPYNISSVSITEKFAPLLGFAVTLHNDMTLNAEYRDGRTLTLNTSAGQVVESTSQAITLGMGYKIVGFNTVLKMRGSQQGISNDLSVNGEFAYQLNQALIRRIESNYTQATSGSRTISLNVNANYIMSRRFTVGMFLEHRINTPIVSANAYPITSTAYGVSFNLSLSR